MLVAFVFSVLVLKNLKPNQRIGGQSLKSVIIRVNSAVVLRALVQLKSPFNFLLRCIMEYNLFVTIK